MRKEKRIKKVVFEFKDGSTKTLEGEELEKWTFLCTMHSDYLLPGNESMVLMNILGGAVRGFNAPETIDGKIVTEWK